MAFVISRGLSRTTPRGFGLPVTHLDPPERRGKVIRALEERGDENALAIAEPMRRGLER